MVVSLALLALLFVGSSFTDSANAAQPQAQKPFKIGTCAGISGAMAWSAGAAQKGMILWGEECNRRGGILGRKVEFEHRDTNYKPEEAVRYIREFASRPDIDLAIHYGSSAEAFAVQQVSKETKKLVITSPEATEYTADPKVRSPYCIRVKGNTLCDNIISGRFAAKIAAEKGITRWYTIASDYAYGRDSVATFLEFVKKYSPKAQIVGQSWPKPGEADYSPQIAALNAANPQAVYTPLFAGDLVSLAKQAQMHGMFNRISFFMKDLTDYITIEPIEKALGQLPPGYAGIRYSNIYPQTPGNKEYFDNFVKRFNDKPLNWTWAAYTACLLYEAAVNKVKTTDDEAVRKALKDLTIKAPTGVGPGGTVTLRGRDNTLVNYANGWGVVTPHAPYLKDIYEGSWDEIIKEETAWLKAKGWL